MTVGTIIGFVIGMVVLWPLLGLHKPAQVADRNPAYNAKPKKSPRGCLFWLLMIAASAAIVVILAGGTP